MIISLNGVASARARTALLAIGLFACHRKPTDAHHPDIYVSNEAAGTVTVIDSGTRKVVATIPVGKRPRGLHLSHDGKLLYVALSGSPRGGPGVDEATLPPPDRASDGIGVIDLATLRHVRTLPSGDDPESFDLLDDHTLVVSNEDARQASVVDTATGTIRARVDVGGEPEGVTASPDGRQVYVTSEADGQVSVFDAASAKIIATIPVGKRPRGVAFTRDGQTAFVTNELDGTVTVIDTAKRAAVATIAVPRDGSGPTGPRPMGIAMSRDGSNAFVTTGRGGSIAVIDVADRKLDHVISNVGARPWGIAVGPDDRLYTANGSSDDVSVIDPDGGRVLQTIPVGGSPWGIAIGT